MNYRYLLAITVAVVALFYTRVGMSAPIETKLDNGVTVIYRYVPSVNVVSVQSWIHTGSVNESAEIAGISHFLEHILFKGTKNFKSGEIDSYLSAKGGYNNAFTSTDVTNYYVTIPSDEAEAAFFVLSDMVFLASFIESEIEKEKPVVLQEIKRKFDDPSYKMWQDVRKSVFNGTAYASEVIGSPKTVSALTPKTLLEYYNKYYHPKNMTLVIVGDIEYDKAIALAKKYFLKTRDVPMGELYSGKDKPKFKKMKDITFEADVNTDYVLLAYLTDKQNLTTVYADEVLSEVLSGGEYSILNEVLKLEKNLAIHATDVSNFNQYHGLFGIFGIVNNGNSSKFKEEVEKIISEIVDGKIDKKRIEKAKNRLKSKFVFDSEEVSSLAQDIGFAYVLDFKDYYLNYTEGVDKVTVKDVAAAAKRLTSSPQYYGRVVPKKTK